MLCIELAYEERRHTGHHVSLPVAGSNSTSSGQSPEPIFGWDPAGGCPADLTLEELEAMDTANEATELQYKVCTRMAPEPV